MGSMQDLGRRERKKQQTRLSIQTHALRLFTERGFENTTIQDITEAADVAKRTFFLHFSSKEDVLVSDPEARIAAFLAAVAARPDEESAFTAIRESLGVLVTLGEEELEGARLRARLLEDAPTLQGADVEKFFRVDRALIAETARRTGLDPDRDLYPRLLAASTFCAVRVGFTLWNHRGGECTADSVVAATTEAFDALAPALEKPI
jgi:AcrR family transcriptional regulator